LLKQVRPRGVDLNAAIQKVLRFLAQQLDRVA
jgi:hypothetical protein